MNRLLALVFMLPWLLPLQAPALDTKAPADWSAYASAADESFAIGDFQSAESKYKQAIDLCADKTKIPLLQVKYTNTLMSQGKFALAGKELKKTLSLAKSVSGESSSDYAEALDLQAWMYQANGKMNDAASCLKGAIGILEEKAKGSSDLADAYEHMGLLAETIGLAEQAKDNYLKALEIRKVLSGKNSVDVADLYESLAQIEFRRSGQSGSYKLFQEALRMKESRGEAWKSYAPEATERTVIFHYNLGAPNCRQGSAEGMIIQQITANGVTVEAGLSQKPSDFAKTTRALVRIYNGSQYDIDVLPQEATFIQVTPTVQILKPLNPQQLARQIEKKGESKAKWIKFWGADATTTVNSYQYSQSNFAPPVYGYVPNAFGWNSYGAPYQQGRRNNWSSSSFMTTQVPDYQKRAEAYRKAEEASTNSKQDALSVREGWLGPNRLLSGQETRGSLDFEFSKYQKAILRIPIGNAVYEFRFE